MTAQVDTSSKSSAYTRALRLLTVRERSTRELHGRLAKLGFEEGVIDAVIADLTNQHLLSDTRYAQCFIHDKLACGWGLERIRRDLDHQGLDIDTVPGFPEEFIEEDEYQRARAVLQRRPIGSKNPQASAYRRLMSKGYSSEVASRVARELPRFKNSDPLTDVDDSVL